MGEDKALMCLGDKPLVLRAVEILSPFVHEVTLLASPERFGNFGLPVIPDLWPDAGPLAAVCTGLVFSDFEWNIFLACDLPLVSPEYMEVLVQRIRATRSHAVVPRTADGWQPLAAAYHARCRPMFARAIQDGQRSIVGLFDKIPVDVITGDEMIRAGLSDAEFTNVNTREEWARVAKLLEGAQ